MLISQVKETNFVVFDIESIYIYIYIYIYISLEHYQKAIRYASEKFVRKTKIMSLGLNFDCSHEKWRGSLKTQALLLKFLIELKISRVYRESLWPYRDRTENKSKIPVTVQGIYQNGKNDCLQ